jgi:hypothetical protein
MANFDFIRYDENGNIIDKHDDSTLRNLFIDFSEKTWGIEFINGTIYGIDLINANDTTFGAEGEDASYEGDRWTGSQRDIFNLGFNTLNVQNRKWHFWGLGGLSKINIEKNKYLETHPGFEKNIYFRVNKDKDQIITVDAEVIRNLEKIHILFNRTVSNAHGPEDWICVPQELCQTYNKQPNGLFLLNGPYCGKSHEERKKEKDEKFKNRIKGLALERKNRNLNNSLK